MKAAFKPPAPEQMRANAYGQLYEAVNTGRLIAYVGSGLSLVYGNITWGEFIDAAVESLQANLQKLLEAGTAGDRPLSNPIAVKRVLAQISALRPDEKVYDEGIVILEMVRQAFQLVDDHQGEERGTSYRETLSSIFDGGRSFLTTALKRRLGWADVKEPLWLKAEGGQDADRGAPAQDEEFYRSVAGIYDLRVLKELAGTEKTLAQLADDLRCEKDRQGGRKDRLPIDRRSLLCLFLAVAKINRRKIPDSLLDRFRKGPLAPLRPLLDPFHELSRDLGIHRFFTTNYDLEMENLFMFDDVRERERLPVTVARLKELLGDPDLELRREVSSLVRTRANGTTIRSDANDGWQTAPLVEFAIGNVDNFIHIYHHHGRVDLPETMIAAGGEYNRMYRAEGRNRPSLDRAYDAMIEGNPILFVGSGLSEEELIRTLRKKVSNPRLGLGAPVFVLRPADVEPKKLLSDQLSLLTKLGIHVIHHGHAHRGARYSLRAHYLLLDAIAKKCRLVERGWALAEKSPPPLPEEMDLETLKSSYRLLYDLDFDRHVILWLLNDGGRRFMIKLEKSADLKPARSAPHRLVLEYLAMLKSKLETASLRHELRQIGRDAKLFFAKKATRIEPRKLPAPRPGKLTWRHISVEKLEERPGLAKRENWRHWSWTPLDVCGEADAEALPEKDEDRCAALIERLVRPPEGQWLREVILGERGVGKGRFLKRLVELLGKSSRASECLVLNCCFGQEVDSVISMIGEFLKGDRKPADISRREFILSSRNDGGVRPLLVLGAVDRLFGTDNQPLGAEFEWLLETLFAAHMKADILITGSMRCAEYLQDLCMRCARADPARKVTEGKHSPPPELGSPSRSDPKVAYRVAVVRAAVPGKVKKGVHNPPPELGSGYLVRLDRQWFEREKNHAQQDRESARIRMTHGSRLIDLVVGRELDALHHGPLGLLGGLAQEILDTLAFVGLPLEAEVLLAAPGVKRALDRLTSDPNFRPKLANALRNNGVKGVTNSTLWRHAFVAALTRATESGLLKMIEGHQKTEPMVAEAYEALANQHRFVLHRLVSQVIRDRFGVPNSETVLSDSFNLSLYAAQRNDAPASDPALAHALEELVDHLLNAWRDTNLNDTLREEIERFRDSLLDSSVYSSNALVPEVLARVRRLNRLIGMLDPMVPAALRAAGGVIRGYFSSMDLLGLDLGDPRRGPGEPSIIVAHKRRIRKLLDRVIEAQAIRANAADRVAFKDFLTKEVLESSALVTANDSGRKEGHRQLLASENIRPFAGLLLNRINIEKKLDRLIDRASTLVDARRVRSLWARLVAQPADARKFEPLNGARNLELNPFYDEEIVWLLNERAMLSLAQGDLYTSSTTFELAFKANRPIEGERYHPNRCRLVLNRSLLWIERGKIAEAERALTDLCRGVGSTEDALPADRPEGQLVRALTTGYLGLCDQLHGLSARADRNYQKALARLYDLRESRAVALFEFHRGTLHHHVEETRDESAACFERALEAVGGARHTDVLYRIRVAKVMNEIRREKIEPQVALAILGAAVDYGDQLDMHRVAVEALSASAELRLKLGDIDSASTDCARALALASQYGMTLRRIWLRGMTGRIYEARGDIANARFIYERAIDAAKAVGYQRAIEAANVNLVLLRKD